MSQKINQLVDAYLKQTQKECYSMHVLDEKPNITDDKIGGIPYLPVGETIPNDSYGNPMELLLQVNLSTIELDNFNMDGIMQVYIAQDLPYPLESKIKIYQPDLPYQEDLVLEVSTESPVRKPFKINLEKTHTYMPTSDFRSENILLSLSDELNIPFSASYTEMDEVWTLIANKMPFATIGGYADFTQLDPRNYIEYKDKTECLFKIDSYLSASNIMFGDMGIIYGLCSENDLKNNKLENVFVGWDCC